MQASGIHLQQVQINCLQIKIRGTAPRRGASAVVELAHWIVQLDKLKNYNKGTTINVGLMEGGTALNMVAPHSKALMEVRYVQPQEFKRVERAIEKLAENPYVEGTQAEVRKLSHYPPVIPTDRTRVRRRVPALSPAPEGQGKERIVP